MNDLDWLANTDKFVQAKQSERAEQILWFIYKGDAEKAGVSINQICDAFSAIGLFEPHRTRLKNHFRKSRKVRTTTGGLYAPSRELSNEMEQYFLKMGQIEEETFEIDSIAFPSFLPNDRKEDLKKMVRAYGYLFLLENSMRGLIEDVLSRKFGDNWWDTAANASMKRKHANRVEKENLKKWAPTRSEFGELYSLDWTDLITLMRKYETDFLPHVKEIGFLHRYEDMGVFRNIVAHNGVLRDEDDYKFIEIYYKNWIKQIS